MRILPRWGQVLNRDICPHSRPDPLAVQQRLVPEQPPAALAGGPGSGDCRGIFAGTDPADALLRAEEPPGELELEPRAIQLVQGGSDLHTDPHRPERLTIRNDHEHALARLVREL